MNEYDLNNLNFILSLNVRGLHEWWDSISQDDKEYALELLRCYKFELIDRAVDLNGDFTLADQVIDSIKSKL